MGDAPSTQPSLLIRLRDARDELAWTHFEGLYGPLIYGFARKHGLQDADAADLRQDVLRLVAGAVRGLEYDARAGSFRGWLFTVVRNQLRKFLGRRPQDRGAGDSATQGLLEQLPAPEDHAAWDEDFRQRLFHYAADQVRGDFSAATWQAFWQTAVQGKPAREVAAGLGLTAAAVYLAKGRVMARLKEQIKLLQEE
jgi:RNA polymerase sigma factor (sigma-70 family)